MDWVNSFNHPRGTVCVLRSVNLRMTALKLFYPERRPEWPGAFSLL